MSRIIFDIETAGADLDDLDKEVREYLLKWAKTEEEVLDVHRSTSFYPTTAQVVAVGMLNPDTGKGAMYYQCPPPQTASVGNAPVGIASADISSAGIPNAGVPNAGVPNAGVPNAGIPNAGVPEAGVSDSSPAAAAVSAADSPAANTAKTPQSPSSPPPSPPPAEPYEEDGIQYKLCTEKEILEHFWAVVKKYDTFVTFNGRTFDCPFMLVRSAVHEVKPTRDLMPNRYGSEHIDLMDRLNFFGASKRRFSMDIWCRTFGIESPKAGGITGYDVKDLYKAGRGFDIARYCAGDLRATRELLYRWERYIKFPPTF